MTLVVFLSWSVKGVKSVKGHGAMGLKVGCTSVMDTTPMTAFLECTDLMRHMLGFITEKEDKQSATLVCKGWREVSHTFPSWRMARLNIKYEDGSYLERVEKQVREPFWYELEKKLRQKPLWDTTRSTIEGMLTQRKHITQYDFNCQYRSTDWWADLATFMPHLTWLSLYIKDKVDKKLETPFALEGLPNLTYLSLGSAYDDFDVYGGYMLSSLSLRLPKLQTLRLDEHGDKEYIRGMRELDIECPSLVYLRFNAHAELSMSTSWFAHLRSLDLTLYDVSACLYDEYCRVINLRVF